MLKEELKNMVETSKRGDAACPACPRPGTGRRAERPVVVWVGDMGFTQAAFGLGQTAELLGVTRQHLRLQELEGNLRTVALGRRKLVPADEIARLLGCAGGERTGGLA